MFIFSFFLTFFSKIENKIVSSYTAIINAIHTALSKWSVHCIEKQKNNFIWSEPK